MLQYLKNFFTPPQIRERQNQLDFRVWLFSRSLFVVAPINFLILIMAGVHRQKAAFSAQLIYILGGYAAAWYTTHDKKNINRYLNVYTTLCYGAMLTVAASNPVQIYTLLAWIPTLVLALHFISEGRGATFSFWVVVNILTCIYMVSKLPPVSEVMLNQDFRSTFAVACLSAVLWAIFYLSAERKMVNGIISLIERQREDNANLARILSHDISSPLQTASGYLPMLRKQGFDDKAGFLDKVQKALANINEIVSKTRELLSLSSGRTKIELQPCGISAVVKDVAHAFELQLNNKNIKLKLQGVEENAGVLISADEILLKHQVLSNLLSNAVKFSHEGGVIEMEVTRGIGVVGFRIRDFGTGMTQEMRERIFMLTRQGQGSTPGTAGEKGTGFGLLIVKTCLDSFGASINVRSVTRDDSPQPGTQVDITFIQAHAVVAKQAA